MNKIYTKAFNSAVKKAKKNIKNPGRISAIIINAGKKLTSERASIKDIKNDLLVLVRLVSKWSKGEYKDVGTKTIIAIVATLVYFINPIDIIPDFVPLIGYTDDATILLYVLNLIGGEIDNFKDWERLDTVNRVSKK